METVLGEGSVPGDFPEEALDFGGNNRIPDGRGGEKEGKGERIEWRKETGNIRLVEGDKSKEFSLERCKRKGIKRREWKRDHQFLYHGDCI